MTLNFAALINLGHNFSIMSTQNPKINTASDKHWLKVVGRLISDYLPALLCQKPFDYLLPSLIQGDLDQPFLQMHECNRCLVKILPPNLQKRTSFNRYKILINIFFNCVNKPPTCLLVNNIQSNPFNVTPLNFTLRLLSLKFIPLSNIVSIYSHDFFQSPGCDIKLV